MAEDTLFPNGDDGGTSGWATGDFTDINEGVASADGLVMSTDDEGHVLNVDLTAPIIKDVDTVTDVNITIRGRETGASAASFFNVDWIIGGTAQGTQQQISALLTTFRNDTVSDVGWDSDWNSGQLDGAQVRITTGQTGMPTAGVWEIDAIDVVVTFTSSGVSIPVVMASYRRHNQSVI